MMLKQKEINQQKLREGAKDVQDVVAFSFNYMLDNNKYSLQSKHADKNAKIKLLNSIQKYSCLTWSSFASSNKDESGVEYIDRKKLSSLKVNIPKQDFYNEIKGFHIFRFGGKNHRICGWRENNICYVLWIDWDLTSYDHGS